MHCLVVEDQQILLDLLATIVDAFSEISTVSKATTCAQAITVSIPLTDELQTMRLVVRRDLHQQPVMAALVTGLSAQHQQQPIQLQSP